MAIEKANKHVNGLIANIDEVDRLSDIHSQITTKGPGRKYNVEILHKSAIVLLVACWEAYVEDLVGAMLEHMVVKAKDHTVFPEYVLKRIGSDHSGLKAWDLAGAGWKKILRGNLQGVLSRTTGSLNTPKTEQVDALFKKAVGLSALSSSWYWPGRSVQQTTTMLDDLVTLRGSIAHRVKTAHSVKLKDVKDARSLVYRLSVKSHNRARAYLLNQLGESPWMKVAFGKTS